MDDFEKLINASDLIEWIMETYPDWCVGDVRSIVDHIEDLPSAQSEIIRCGDCKWFQCNMRMDGYLPKGVDEFECRHWCGSCDPVDFCSHAERRTDG